MEDPAPTDILGLLQGACAKGLVEEVRSYLAAWRNMADPVPPRPPRKPTLGLQPGLLAAVRHNQAEAVSFLLDEGFILEHEAVRIAISNQSIAVLQVFLDHGWKINRKVGGTMGPPLSRALQHADLVRWFLAHGADPNAAVPSWPSPLEKAAWDASLEVIELLVEHGGRVYPGNALPSAGKTSLPGRTDVLAYFMDRGAPINTVEFEHNPAIFKMHWSRGFGTALHHASRRGNDELVKFLLQKGAERSLKDSLGKTALQYAREKNHASTVLLLDDNDASFDRT